jgi:O-antigen/teichoic acid export membrane protein
LSSLLSQERGRLRRVIQLMSGTVVAQLIPVAAAPLLTRLFTPAELGVLTIFVSLSTVLAQIAAGRYELALGLPRRTRQAAGLLHLCVAIILSFAVLLALAIRLGDNWLAGLLGGLQWRTYLPLLPLSLALTGLYQTANYWLNRNTRFGAMARVNVLRTATTAVSSVLAGVAGLGAIGLICSTLIGYAAGTLTAAAAMLKGFRGVGTFTPLSRMRALAIRYKSFPLLSAPGALADVIAVQLPAIVIAHTYEPSTVGYFGLTLRVVGIPSILLGYAIGQVYYQSVASAAARGQPVSGLIGRAVRLLMLIAAVPYALLLFLGKPLFAVVFGHGWWQAGLFASILAPAFWLRFVASTVSLSLPALNRNDIAIRWQVINLVTVVGVLGVASRCTITVLMVALCFQYLVVYALYLWLILWAARRHETRS